MLPSYCGDVDEKAGSSRLRLERSSVFTPFRVGSDSALEAVFARLHIRQAQGSSVQRLTPSRVGSDSALEAVFARLHIRQAQETSCWEDSVEFELMGVGYSISEGELDTILMGGRFVRVSTFGRGTNSCSDELPTILMRR